MYRVLETCGSDRYKAFLSGENNFRYLLDPEYKAHRKDKQKPIHLDACREIMVTEWKSSITYGYEADDAIGMLAGEDTVIISNDKDFLQIPGRHYNPVTNVFKEVDEDEAAYNFWTLMLVGDTADNVRGVDGIGVKKAAGILDNLATADMYETVLGLYDDEERFVTNYFLLKILRNEDELEAMHDFLKARSFKALDRMAADAQEWGLYD